MTSSDEPELDLVLAEALLALSSHLVENSERTDEALSLLGEVRSLCDNIETQSEASTLSEVGDLRLAAATYYSSLEHRKEAVEEGRKSANIFMNISEVDQTYKKQLFVSLNNLACDLIISNHIDEARTLTEKAIDLVEQLPDLVEETDKLSITVNAAVALTETGQPDKAITLLSDRFRDPDGNAPAAHHLQVTRDLVLGSALSRTGNVQEAERVGRRAHGNALNSDNATLRLASSNSLALVLTQAENRTEARAMLESTLSEVAELTKYRPTRRVFEAAVKTLADVVVTNNPLTAEEAKALSEHHLGLFEKRRSSKRHSHSEKYRGTFYQIDGHVYPPVRPPYLLHLYDDTLFVAGESKNVYFYRTSGDCSQLNESILWHQASSVVSVSGTENFVCTLGQDGFVKMWSKASHTHVADLKPIRKQLRRLPKQIVLIEDLALLAYVSNDGIVSLHQLVEGARFPGYRLSEVKSFHFPQGVLQISYAVATERLLVLAADNKLFELSLRDLEVLNDETEGIRRVSGNSYAGPLVVETVSGSLEKHSTAGADIVGPLRQRSHVRCLWECTNDRVVFLGKDDHLIVFNLQGGKIEDTIFITNAQEISQISLSTKKIAIATKDRISVLAQR